MKMRVTRAFTSDALKVLNMYSKKKSSLIDFIFTLPELATKAATIGNILHGFYERGLIDRKVKVSRVVESIRNMSEYASKRSVSKCH